MAKESLGRASIPRPLPYQLAKPWGLPGLPGGVEALYECFLKYLRNETNLARESIDCYAGFMRLILGECPNPSPEDIKSLKRRWIDEGRGACYINKMLSTAAHYFRMLGLEVRFKRLSESEGIVEYLEDYQVREVFRVIDESSKNEHLRLRNRAIVACSLYGSARRKEICQLRVDDVDPVRRIIMFRRPKNKVPDVSYLNNQGARILEEWLNYRAGHRYYRGTRALFLGEHGETLTPDGVSQALKYISDKCGFRVTITILRHTLGTWMRIQGADLLDIKAQLRHRNIRSTLKYVNTADKRLLKERVDKYVPEF